MPASVYIESSVISYLTARPSRDIVTAARQAITLDWWQNQRHLLTWNFKHINNAVTKPLIASVIEAGGYVCPIFCSPEELGVFDYD